MRTITLFLQRYLFLLVVWDIQWLVLGGRSYNKRNYHINMCIYRTTGNINPSLVAR